MHFKCNLLNIYWNGKYFDYYLQRNLKHNICPVCFHHKPCASQCYYAKGIFGICMLWHDQHGRLLCCSTFAELRENFFLCNVALWCIIFLRIWRPVMWTVDLSMYTTAYSIAVLTLIQLSATRGGVWSLVDVSHTCHCMLWTKHKCSVCSH
jgi:hypothetical protein